MKFAVVTLLLFVYFACCSSVTLAQNTPPASVLAEARRMGTILGYDLSQPPTHSIEKLDRQSGHSLWTLKWFAGSSLIFTVDANSNKIVGFTNELVMENATQAFQTGQVPSLTQSQVEMAINSLSASLSLSTGDWRIARIDSSTYTSGKPYWIASKRRYVNGYPVTLGNFVTYWEPYTGKVTAWQYTDTATLLQPTAPLFTREQLKATAIAAFRSYASSLLRPSDPTEPLPPSTTSPVWIELGPETTISRLTYPFLFYLSEINDPNYDGETNETYNGRPAVRVLVELDAETGEVLNVGLPVGGGSPTALKPFVYTPRVALLRDLCKTSLETSKLQQVLQRAVAGGKSVTAQEPSPLAKRFTALIAGHTVNFALNLPAKRLTWQMPSGNWTGISLSDSSVATLKSFADW
jgi:hypothetical protein